MFFSSLKTLVSRVVIFSLQVRCSNVKMSTTIVKRCFHPMIILPYACYQSVTNTVWASLARTECGDCGDALCCASPSSCSHKPSPSCQGDASVNTFQRRDHLALSSLRFALGQALSASFGSLSGERSFAALRMTLLPRLRLTRRTSSLKWIGRKRPYGYEAACEAMSHNDSQLAKQGKQIAGYGGDSEGDVTQYLPVKARHPRLRWPRWAR